MHIKRITKENVAQRTMLTAAVVMRKKKGRRKREGWNPLIFISERQREKQVS